MLTYADEMFIPIRDYVPSDARKIIDDQIPLIKQAIRTKVDQFAGQLGTYVSQKVAEIQKQQEVDLQAAEDELGASIQKLKASAGAGAAAIDEAAAGLNQALKQYRDKWTGLGKSLQQAIMTGLRASGIPIPPAGLPV